MNWIEHFDHQKRRELQALYAAEWWTKTRTAQDVDQVIDHSQISIGLCSEDAQLVGFARVLTDFRFKALVFDVIVRADQRGKGLGKAIMAWIEAHPALHAIETIELYCQDHTAGFYERLGYVRGTATRLYKGFNPAPTPIARRSRS